MGQFYAIKDYQLKVFNETYRLCLIEYKLKKKVLQIEGYYLRGFKFIPRSKNDLCRKVRVPEKEIEECLKVK